MKIEEKKIMNYIGFAKLITKTLLL